VNCVKNANIFEKKCNNRSVPSVVVVNFIFSLFNNINNKENNSKPEKGHNEKTIYVKTCTR